MNETLEELLKTCEHERLHLSGAIQPHGALLHVDGGGVVTHVSANVRDVVGPGPNDLLGRPLHAVMRDLEPDELVGEGTPGERMSIFNEAIATGKTCDVHLTRSFTGWLVELYPAWSGKRAGPRSSDPLSVQLLNMRRSGWRPEVESVCEVAAKTVCELVGLDKVMVYRFAEDWSGEVIAEVDAEDRKDYLGLRFPATDIPKIARDLYVLNPVRMIPDVDAAPVPVLSNGSEPLDLTYADLRSVSPVHLQYLRNMNVAASCSFSIEVRGRLWGLVACHHRKPQTLDLWTRTQAVEVVRTLTWSVATLAAEQRIRFIDGIDRELANLVERLTEEGSLAEGLQKHQREVLALLSSDGGALLDGDRCTLFGSTPTDKKVLAIADVSAAYAQHDVFSTDRLGELLPGFDVTDAAGALVVHVPASSTRGRLRFAWFRPEVEHTVMWAGDPNRPAEVDPQNESISPRKSFARWQQIMHGRSKPWTPQDQLAAQKFRNLVLRWLNVV